MKAYLEKINKEWLDDFVYSSKYRLESMGYEIIPFDGERLVSGEKSYEFTKNDILIGSVEATVFFLSKLGVNVPEYIGYPESLSEFYGRRIEVKRVDELDHNFPYFIKPAKQVKLFTGDVITNVKLLNLFTNFYDVKPETLLYVSEVLDIVSEYRCFVHKGKLTGIQYYLGDFRIYPDTKIVDDMIGKYQNSPIAYTLDVGVTSDGKTIIVEVNDMWAIGMYGLKNDIYVKACVDRMKEIIKNN